MVDIHCHILPGLDDGPKEMAGSIEMAKMAIAEGITHLVATPHSSDTYVFKPDLIRERCEELRAAAGDKLALATGCDFHMNFENMQALRKEPARFTINQKNYLLVEFADFVVPPAMDGILKEMLVSGITPIITHPERNPVLRSRPQRMLEWVGNGCFVQVTAGSLLGRFGPLAKGAVERWLDHDFIHFFASDGHNVTSRPVKLREAYDAVAKRKNVHVANALFRENPLAAFEGRPLPYTPAPQFEEKPDLPKKRFRFF